MTVEEHIVRVGAGYVIQAGDEVQDVDGIIDSSGGAAIPAFGSTVSPVRNTGLQGGSCRGWNSYPAECNRGPVR